MIIELVNVAVALVNNNLMLLFAIYTHYHEEGGKRTISGRRSRKEKVFRGLRAILHVNLGQVSEETGQLKRGPLLVPPQT